MKQTRNLINGLVACGIALAMVSTLAAQTIEGAAKVVRMKGAARFSTGNNNWQPLRVGDVLKPGTVVQTSKDDKSFVDLVLGDGNASVAALATYKPSVATAAMAYQPTVDQNVVRIFANSALGIDKLTTQQTGADQVTETQLDLKQGHIMGSVKKMSAASKFEVKLPNGVAGIRGTIYDITSDGVVRVLTGSVVIAYVGADGSVVTQVVAAGYKFDAHTGQVMEMTSGEKGSINAPARDMRVPQGQPTQNPIDHTIYHVSPVYPNTPANPQGVPFGNR